MTDTQEIINILGVDGVFGGQHGTGTAVQNVVDTILADAFTLEFMEALAYVKTVRLHDHPMGNTTIRGTKKALSSGPKPPTPAAFKWLARIGGRVKNLRAL